ncbi:MAG TPA: hypothetical protein VD815_06410 [Candidatus Saccharimonadales bacterium]|nr:hypothetical protein [Candidatus Saccharimonadales bacterium]
MADRESCLKAKKYLSIKHLKIVSRRGKLYGIFERYIGDPEYDGICYFEIEIDKHGIGDRDNDPTKSLSEFLQYVVDKNDHLIVKSSEYGNYRLKDLYLDIDDDINITYIPLSDNKVNKECIFYGIIRDKKYTPCPSTPIVVEGKVEEIFTFFKKKDGEIHPIRIYKVDRCWSDDQILCNVDNEGHWGPT